MDLQTLIIGIAIFVISAILIYLISICTMREKTYEEVIAEQKRQQEETMLKTRVEKKEKRLKYKKGKGHKSGSPIDKTEDKSSQVSDQESEHPRKMLEIELEPEIIEPTEIHPPVLRKRKGKQKSILINKDDKVFVRKEISVEEQFHPHDMPKDDLELKHEKDRKLSLTQDIPNVEKAQEQRKKNKKQEQKVKEPKEEKSALEIEKDKVEKTTSKVEKSSPKMEKSISKPEKTSVKTEKITPKIEKPSKVEITISKAEKITKVEKATAKVEKNTVVQSPMQAEQKKLKKAKTVDSGNADVSGKVDSNRLVTSIQSAKLSNAEVQSLIDILLTKQGGTGTSLEWTKKSKQGDQLAVLKKQLEEKEEALREEQSLSLTSATKLKELRQELGAEKQRAHLVEKKSREKMAKEMEALHARMQQSHEQHVGEVNNMRMQMEQMKGQTQMVQRQREENQKLSEKASQVQAMDMGNMQRQMKIMQEELNKNVVKLNSSENAKKNLENKLGRYEDQIRQMEANKRDTENVYTRKLNEVNDELRRGEARNVSVTRDFEQASSAIHQKDQEMGKMLARIKEVESSKVENEDAFRNLQNRLKDGEKANSELQVEIRASQSTIAELSHLNHQKEDELQTLRMKCESLHSELHTVKERTQGEGQEFPAKPVVQAQYEAGVPENSFDRAEHDRLVGEKEMQNAQLTTELSLKVDEIGRLMQDLDGQKKKNNALREKNWKAMEALSEAEKRSDIEMQCKESEIQKIAAELSRLKRTNNDLEVQVQSNASLRSDLEIAQQKVSSLEQQLGQAGSHSDSLQKDIENAQQMVTELKGEKQMWLSIQSDAQRSSEEANSLRHQLQEKVSTFSAIEQELLMARHQNQALQESRLAATKIESRELARVQDELAMKNIHIQNLMQTLEEFTKENNTFLEEKQRAEAASISAQRSADDILRLQESLSEKEGLLEKLRVDLEATQKEKQDLTGRTEAAVVDAKKYADAISRLQGELSEKDTSVTRLQRDLEQTNLQKNELQEEKQKLEAASTELQKATEQNCKLQEELAQKDRNLENVLSELDIAQKERNALQEGKDQTDAAIADGQKSADDISRLERDLSERDNHVKQLQDELTSLKSQNQGLEKDRQRAESAELAAKKSESDISSLQDVLSVKETTVSKLLEDIESLKKENNEVKQKEAASSALVDQSTATIARLDNELIVKTIKMEKMYEELEVTKMENDELRSGCKQATEALSKAEKSAEEIAQVQGQLKARVAEVGQLQEALRSKDAELTAIKSAVPIQNGSSESTSTETHTDTRHYTVLTRIEEKSSLDVSGIVEDLDEKTAELTVLQQVLLQKENELSKLYANAEGVTSSTTETSTKQQSHLAADADAVHEDLVHTQGEVVLMTRKVEDISNLHEELNDKLSSVMVLQEELEQHRQENDELRLKIEQGSQDLVSNADLPTDVAELQQQVLGKDVEMGKLRDIVKDYWTENNTLREELDKWEASKIVGSGSDVTQQLTAVQGVEAEVEMYKSQVETLQDKYNNTLSEIEKIKSHYVKFTELDNEVKGQGWEISRLKNQLILQTQENDELKQKYAELQTVSEQKPEQAKTESDNTSAEAQVSEERQVAIETLKRLFPEVTVSESLTYSEWIATFEKIAIIELKGKSSAQPDSPITDTDTRKLQSQVQHYKTVLAQTESILNKLQNSVESEERKWQQKVGSSEAELHQARDEIRRLIEENKEMKTTSSKDLAAVKGQLEDAERARSSLTSNNTRLEGLLCARQEALRAEQNRIQALECELLEHTKVVQNGTSDASDEVQELRTKLNETERQLDMEIQANKQLMQRLGASVANEDGTSV